MEFTPGVYEHAAACIGRRPWDVSRSRELLVSAHAEAWNLYHHRLLVAGIDVYNIEPEALGAVVMEAPGDNVPALGGHPLEEIEQLADIAEFDPTSGRYPMILGAASELATICPVAEIRVPMCGPMALANGLLGMENLLVSLMEDPELAVKHLTGLLRYQCGYMKAIKQAGVRPIIFESGTTPPMLSASLFLEIEAPVLARMFQKARSIFGEDPPCIIGGDSAPVAAAFLSAGPGYVIAPSETDQAAFLEIAIHHPSIHTRVNMNASILLSNDWKSIEIDARRAASLADSRPNSSVGCGVVPYEASPTGLLKIRDFIQSQAWA